MTWLTPCFVGADHPCPVIYGLERRLGDGTVKAGWCWDHFGPIVKALPSPVGEADVDRPELLLVRDKDLAVYYTVFDWVNTKAKVALVGITPGRRQAGEALASAHRDARQGFSAEQVLSRADATGSFAGGMRTNLVRMLDQIGVAEALDIPTCDRLFDEAHYLAAHASAIYYPVLVKGANYGGSSRIAPGYGAAS